MRMTLSYKNFDFIGYLSALLIVSTALIALACSASLDSSSSNTNPPRYPSLSAFEYYDPTIYKVSHDKK